MQRREGEGELKTIGRWGSHSLETVSVYECVLFVKSRFLNLYRRNANKTQYLKWIVIGGGATGYLCEYYWVTLSECP